jgi:beta-galactosidase
MKINFDDSKWQDGKGGFGMNVPNHGVVGTPWSTPHIWLRRHFNPGALTAAQISTLCVTDYHDDDVSVFINGVPGFASRGFQVDYENKPLTPESRAAVLTGADNVLAVEGDNEGGGQYVDVGLSTRKLKPQ